MDTDIQELDGGVPNGAEAALSIEGQAITAIEPETPLMLTDTVCGLACQLRGDGRVG